MLIMYCTSNLSHALHTAFDELAHVHISTKKTSDSKSIIFELVSSPGDSQEKRHSLILPTEMKDSKKLPSESFFLGEQNGRYFFKWDMASYVKPTEGHMGQLSFVLDPRKGLSLSGSSLGARVTVTGDMPLRIEEDDFLSVGSLKHESDSLFVGGTLLTGHEGLADATLISQCKKTTISAMGKVISYGNSFFNVKRFVNNGALYSDGKATVLARISLKNTAGGKLVSGHDLNLKASLIENCEGYCISQNGSFKIKTDHLDNTRGIIRGLLDSEAHAQATDIINRFGYIQADAGSLNIFANLTLDNSGGSIVSLSSQENEKKEELQQKGRSKFKSQGVSLEFGCLDNQCGYISDIGHIDRKKEFVINANHNISEPFLSLYNKDGLIYLTKIDAWIAGSMMNDGVVYPKKGGKILLGRMISSKLDKSKILSDETLDFSATHLDLPKFLKASKIVLKAFNTHQNPESKIDVGSLTLEGKEGCSASSSATISGEIVAQDTQLATRVNFSETAKTDLGNVDLIPQSGSIRVAPGSDVKMKAVDAKWSDYNQLTRCSIEDIARITAKDCEKWMKGDGFLNSKLLLSIPKTSNSEPASLLGSIGGREGTIIDSEYTLLMKSRPGLFSQIGFFGGDTAVRAPSIYLRSGSHVNGQHVFLESTQTPLQAARGSVIHGDTVTLDGMGAVLSGVVRANTLDGTGKIFDIRHNINASSISLSNFAHMTVQPHISLSAVSELSLNGRSKDAGGSYLSVGGVLVGGNAAIDVTNFQALSGQAVRQGTSNNWSQVLASQPTIQGRNKLSMKFETGVLQTANLLSGTGGMCVEADRLTMLPSALESYHHTTCKRGSDTYRSLIHSFCQVDSVGDATFHINAGGVYHDYATVMRTGGNRSIQAGKGATRHFHAVQDHHSHESQRKKKKKYGVFRGGTRHSSHAWFQHRGHQTFAGLAAYNKGGHAIYEGAFHRARYGTHEIGAESLTFKLGWNASQQSSSTQESGFFVNMSSQETMSSKDPVQTVYEGGVLFDDISKTQLNIQQVGSVNVKPQSGKTDWVQNLVSQLKSQGAPPAGLTTHYPEFHYDYDEQLSMGVGTHIIASLALAAATSGMGTALIGAAGFTSSGALAMGAGAAIDAAVCSTAVSAASNTFSGQAALAGKDFENALLSASTAGVSKGLLVQTGLSSSPSSFQTHLQRSAVNQSTTGVINLAANRGRANQIGDAFLQGVVADTIGGFGANKLGFSRYSGRIDGASHKLLHGGLGALTGAVLSGNLSKGDHTLRAALGGAVGAITAETVGEFLGGHTRQIENKISKRADDWANTLPENPQLVQAAERDLHDYRQALIYDQRVAGFVGKASGVLAAYGAGLDPYTAKYTATNAVDENYLSIIPALVCEILAAYGFLETAKTVGKATKTALTDGITPAIDEYGVDLAVDAGTFVTGTAALKVSRNVGSFVDAKTLLKQNDYGKRTVRLKGTAKQSSNSIDVAKKKHSNVAGIQIKRGEQPWSIREGQEWKRKVIGKAQVTGTKANPDKAHAFKTYRKAIKEAQKADTQAVLLNRGYNRLPGVNIRSNRRPDALIVKKNGKVNAHEVASKTDVPRDLRVRNMEARSKLPEFMRGKYTDVLYKETK